MRKFRILTPIDYDVDRVFHAVEEKLIGVYMRRNGVRMKRSIQTEIHVEYLGVCKHSKCSAWEVEFEISRHMDRKLQDLAGARSSTKEQTFFFHLGVRPDFSLKDMLEAAASWISSTHRITEDLLKIESLFSKELVDYGIVLDEL